MTADVHFVTSALPYVNNVPHLGNIIGSTLSADVHARYLRRMKKRVFYLCGTDEYGTTTEVKALQDRVSCQEICDKYHQIHKMVYEWFNISFDAFGRTTTNTHKELAQDIFLKLYYNGLLERTTIEQYKCASCNRFLADRYIKGVCYVCSAITKGDQCDACGTVIDVDKLKQLWCAVCSNIPVKCKTDHLFLTLEQFKKEIRDQIMDPLQTRLTNNARGITESWLNKELESRCITRDLKWGTPVPFVEGLEDMQDKVFYVWFDAPIGYLSILKHHVRDNWKEWLTGKWVQFMAKDNVPFHTIIFPATLIGAGREFPLVTDLSCTEYLSYEGKKFSKSNNIGIFGDHVIELSKLLDIDEDYWRYYLLKIRPETGDSSFNWKEFCAVVRGELVNNFGNLISRAVSLTKKYYPGKDKLKYNLNDDTFITLGKQICICLDNYYNISYHSVIKYIGAIADIGNAYVNKNELWSKCKINPEENEYMLGNLLYICWCVAELLFPIMPKKSEKIKSWIKGNEDVFVEQIVQSGEITFCGDDYNMLFKSVDIKKVNEALYQIGIDVVV